MKEKNIEIELYEDVRGRVDLLIDMPVRDRVRFVNKNILFQQFTFRQFLSSKNIVPIQGHRGYYEIKYFFTHPPYRAIAIIHKEALLLLIVFKGSGSKGRLERYIKQAVSRASEWNTRT